MGMLLCVTIFGLWYLYRKNKELEKRNQRNEYIIENQQFSKPMTDSQLEQEILKSSNKTQSTKIIEASIGDVSRVQLPKKNTAYLELVDCVLKRAKD